MAQKNATSKKHTTARKAECAKRGKRHVYQAPPAPVKYRIQGKAADLEAATAKAKALMAAWS